MTLCSLANSGKTGLAATIFMVIYASDEGRTSILNYSAISGV
jgi:hypothetical protein